MENEYPFLQMILKQLDLCMLKNETPPIFHCFSKKVTDLNIKDKNIKFLEENIGKKILVTWDFKILRHDTRSMMN